jgi:hypothetical protein
MAYSVQEDILDTGYNMQDKMENGPHASSGETLLHYRYNGQLYAAKKMKGGYYIIANEGTVDEEVILLKLESEGVYADKFKEVPTHMSFAELMKAVKAKKEF